MFFSTLSQMPERCQVLELFWDILVDQITTIRHIRNVFLAKKKAQKMESTGAPGGTVAGADTSAAAGDGKLAGDTGVDAASSASSASAQQPALSSSSSSSSSAAAAQEQPAPHVGNDDPLVKCRCGCVPKDMMSLFQMAELRAKMREEKRRKEAEQSAQNLPTGRM
jgi:hypothetical protein